MKLFLVSILAIALFEVPGFAQTCYLSNGTVSQENGVKDTPCRPDDPHSSCCSIGGKYACAANGLCSEDGVLFVIGSCTDPLWEDPSCPNICNAKFHIHNAVTKCDKANTYCCADGPACKCATGVNTINFLDNQPKYSVLIAKSSSTSSFSSTSSTTSNILLSASSILTSTSSIPPTSSQTTSTSTSTSTSNIAPPAQSNNNLAVGLGAGLGVALFFSLAGLGAFLFWRKKKKEEKASSVANTESVPSYPYADKAYAPPTLPVEVDSHDTWGHYPPQQMIYEAPGTFTYPGHTPVKGGS